MQKTKVKTLLTTSDELEKSDKENVNNTNEERHENIVVTEVARKKSLRDVPDATGQLIDGNKKYEGRKRYSIGNGELRVNGKTREVSPTARMAQQRKLSADMRLRTGNYNMGEDYIIRRPVRLKSMSNNLETYDSLHTKAGYVSACHFCFPVWLTPAPSPTPITITNALIQICMLATSGMSVSMYPFTVHGQCCARRKLSNNDNRIKEIRCCIGICKGFPRTIFHIDTTVSDLVPTL